MVKRSIAALLVFSGCSLSEFTPHDAGTTNTGLDRAMIDAADRVDPDLGPADTDVFADAELDAGEDAGEEDVDSGVVEADTGIHPDAEEIDLGEPEDTGPPDLGFEDAALPGNQRVRVTLGGNGEGSVTSMPGGINCPGTCFADFLENSSVTLTAQVFRGSIFSGWMGCDTTNNLSCTVTANMEREVTATFTLEQFTLTIQQMGATGNVRIEPIGQTCNAGTCNYQVNFGTDLTITSSSAGGNGFSHFNGTVCRGGSCSFEMTRASTIQVVHSSGLVANYPLDIDGRDVSGHNHSGALQGQPQTVTGTLGGALMFAMGQAVAITDQAELESMGDLTVCLWVEPGVGSTGQQVLLEKAGAYSLTISGRMATRGVRADVTANEAYSASATIPDDRWSHVCLVYNDNVALSDVLWIYVDGAERARDAAALLSGPVVNTPATLTIGGCAINCGRDFDGAIDQVKIWRRGLTQPQIAAETDFP